MFPYSHSSIGPLWLADRRQAINYPPAPHGWRIQVMLANGHIEQAHNLLAALNRVEVAFGGTAYDLPKPATKGVPNLVTCPAQSLVARDLNSELQL